MLDRIHGRGNGVESPIGFMPRHQDIHWEGLEYDPDVFYSIMSVDRDQIKRELNAHEDLFDNFYDRLPKELIYHRELMKSRLWRSPKVWEMPRQLF